MFRDHRPGIAVGGVQPAATEVQVQPAELLRPGASAETRAGFQQQGRKIAAGQAPRRSHTRGAAADDDDVDVRTQKSLMPESCASLAMSWSWKRGSCDCAAGVWRSR